MANFTQFKEKGDTQYYLKESIDNSNRLLKEMGYANLEFVKKPFKNDYDIFVVNSGIVKYVRGEERSVCIHIILHKDSNTVSIMDGEDTLYDIHDITSIDKLIYTQQEVIKRVLSGTENLLRETTANIDKELDDED